MRLQKIRKSKKLTQAELAARVGITREYLARIETAKHDPRLSLLRRLAKELHVTIAELVG